MSKRLSWKMKFSIVMILLIIIIYGSNYLVLGDAEHIISYVWTHLGFIPVDILLVAFILDEIIEKKEKEAMLEKLDMLDSCAEFFAMWQPKMEEKFKEQITSRFNELLGDHVDENRIMTEVAAMLVKYTINEEIIRLKSHLEALRKEITSSPVPGKRLDFICQEANREINTIGSKNQFAEVGAMVVNAKDALENIREQSKNVE